MNTIQKFAIAASVSLAFALTLSCSDDKDGGGSYLSCDEAEKVAKECREVYNACIASCAVMDYDCEDACEDVDKKNCIDNANLCGNSKISIFENEECQAHYYNECGIH